MCGERAHTCELWPRLHSTSLGVPRSILSSPLPHKGVWVQWTWLGWGEEDPTFAPLVWKPPTGKVLAWVLAQGS